MAQARYQLDIHWEVWELLERWLSSPELYLTHEL